MLDALTWAATEAEVDLESRVVNEFTGYRLSDRDPQVRLARQALEALGYAPYARRDRRWLRHQRVPAERPACVNLCNDMIDVHTPDERIAVESLERTVDVCLALVDAARTFA